MYLLDLWRGQTSSDIWIEAWCDLVKKWRPSFWAEEHGQIISGVGPFLKRRAIERHAYTSREQFVGRGDKAVRAQSIRLENEKYLASLAQNQNFRSDG